MVKPSNQSQWLPERGWGAIQGPKAQNRDNTTTMEVWDELDWGEGSVSGCRVMASYSLHCQGFEEGI